MNQLEQKIVEKGEIKEKNILKVDSFLNHQIDVELLKDMAEEWQKRFENIKVDKILTIEASGIAIGTILAAKYDVPLVYAKKSETVNCTDDKYISQCFSFTHKKTNKIMVSKPYLSKGENILIVDDFIADGEAMSALTDIVEQAGAKVAGIAIAIEKGQQKGGDKIRKKGYHLESMAIIESMDYETQSIKFAGKEAIKISNAK